ncbi:DNA primase, partial [Xenorhabdus sp. GDc328]|uniref:primase-helicase family protein n=2 Tax=Xenorhabdus TaxID=626 RepID=UPI0006C02D4D
PSSTAGFKVGHFKCLHASCAHRNDGDFLNAIEFGVRDFEDLTEQEGAPNFTDINTDMTSHFIERFIYVVKGDQVCDLSRPPYRSIMDMKSFKNLMAPFQFPAMGKGQPTPATKRWLEHPKKLVAESTGYHPGKGRLIQGQDGWLEINEFYLPEHQKVANFTKAEAIFLKHIAYLVPDESQRLFFIARLAWMVQRPERRCPVTVLHISVLHGTGRGWVIQLMESILGHWNCTRAKMDVICKNQYHDYLYHSLLCTVDEVKENIEKRYSVNDQLRDLLTEPRFEVNNKYGKKMTMDIFTHFLFFSNHIDAIYLPPEDRRIAVFGGPDFLQGDNYFKQLYQALKDPEFIAQVYWYLMGIDLDAFDWQRAPETEERQLMIDSSRTDADKVLFDLLADPPVAAMTYQQIVSYIVAELGLDADINPKRVSGILRSKGLGQAGAIKFEGKTERPWVLVKNRKFSNEQLRTELESCKKLLIEM